MRNNVNFGLESLAYLKSKDLEHHNNLRKEIPYLSLKWQLKNRIQVHALLVEYISRI